MNKTKDFVKIAAIIIYGYCSAFITPYLIRLALGIRNGIGYNDIDGKMFIIPSIILLIIFAVIDFAIIMLVIKSSNKTKTQKSIIISIFALSMIVAYITIHRDVINLAKDITYLLTH